MRWEWGVFLFSSKVEAAVVRDSEWWFFGDLASKRSLGIYLLEDCDG